MTTEAELAKLFDFHQDTPRIVGFGSSAAIVRENQATAIAVSVQLLNPKDKMPSGKSLFLQLQPSDAMVLAGAILAHAREKNWPVPPELLDMIERVQLSPDQKKH